MPTTRRRTAVQCMLVVATAATMVAPAEASTVQGRTSCPGKIDVKGYGDVAFANALWATPDLPAGNVELAGSEVRPHMMGRTYFSDWCANETHASTWYSIFKLLGKRLRYTTDLSGAGCGCYASLHLAPMFQNRDPSKCRDYYCDARATCGVQCNQISIQEANKHAWHSTLRRSGDTTGVAVGYGGSLGWGASQSDQGKYGPMGSCIDTSKPFQVSASFPTDASGNLASMEVELSQAGRSCPMSANVGYGPAAMAELTSALKHGMTSVISYWGADDTLWLDGMNGDGVGPCKVDTPWKCGRSASFYDFSVEDIRKPNAKCDGAWQQPPSCATTFTYNGEEFAGCTQVDSPRPWCSMDPLYTGRWMYCQPCARNEVEQQAALRGKASTTTRTSTNVPQAENSGHFGDSSRTAPPTSSAAPSPVSGGLASTCQWPLRLEHRNATLGWEVFEWIDMGEDKVSLLTFHSKYVAVDEDGTVRADFKHPPGKAGLFWLLWHGGGYVSMRTAHGKFLAAKPDGTIHANPDPKTALMFKVTAQIDGTVNLRVNSSTFLIAEDRFCVPSCAMKDSSFEPSDVVGMSASQGGDAAHCQARCIATPGCAHFTFFSAGRHCHLAASGAVQHVGIAGAISGPKDCSDLMVMRRYAQPEGPGRTKSDLIQQRPWVVAGLMLLSLMPASTAAVCLARRASAGQGGWGIGSARSVFRSELLRVEEGDEELTE